MPLNIALQISFNNDLPKVICENCYQTIEDIYLFREKIVQNEITLHNKFIDLYKSIDSKNFPWRKNIQEYKPNLENKSESTKSNTVENKEINETVAKANNFTPVFVTNSSVEEQMDQATQYVSSELNNEEMDLCSTSNTVENEGINDTVDETSTCTSVFVTNTSVGGQIDQATQHVTPEVNNEETDLTHAFVNDNDNLSSEDELLIFKNVKNSDLELLDHKVNPTEDKMCLTCFKKFPNRVDLLKHYQTYERFKHTPKKKDKESEEFKFKIVASNDTILYKCELCHKEYKSESYIKRHFLIHKDRPFLCRLCGRTYGTATDILNHGRAHGGALFVCSYKCGYGSVYKHVMKVHERKHKKEFKYSCETCGKQFQVKTWYLQHQNIHTGVKPYICNICGMAFHLDRYLTQHRSSVHPEAATQKRFVCMHCSAPCGNKNNLVIHLQEHNIKTDILCDECGKILKNNSQLKGHKKIHLDPKPYECGICSKRYTKKSNLTVHIRNHTGEMYSCDKCPKKFTQRSSLTRHKETIGRCSKAKCTKCNKTFWDGKEYINHKISCS